MGGRTVPHPGWECGVAQTNLHGLRALLEVVWGLLQKGLSGEELLWTSLSHRVQP
jgi:hypothetical protein